MDEITNNAKNYPLVVTPFNQELFMWQGKIRQNNYDRLYFDEIEKYLGESILNGLYALYGIKSKKAADKSVMIEKQLKEIKEMNPISKVGYNAKRAGKNIYFTSFLLVKEIEMFLKEGHLMPEVRRVSTGKKKFILTNSSKHLSTIDIDDQIIFIASGIAYATFEKFLQNELIQLLNKETENILPVNNKKIKWKGTPGEFGAIFNLLFEKGYIENPTIKKDIIEQLNKIFEIKTDENKIATDAYLYRCFGEKVYQYPAGHLKIPLSINYHKDK